jgi:hypothetical protein
MAQQGGQAGQPDPIAQMALQMLPLLPEWELVLENLGITNVDMKTLARAQGITDLEVMSIYSKEDIRHIFKQLRSQTVIPQIIEVWALALTQTNRYRPTVGPGTGDSGPINK